MPELFVVSLTHKNGAVFYGNIHRSQYAIAGSMCYGYKPELVDIDEAETMMEYFSKRGFKCETLGLVPVTIPVTL